MTDREPDDLYDALRDRLTDFGQEPPAPLWATIRAQLPPPVAAPQLRRRTRRRALAALALLLLLGLSTWQWWPPNGQPNGKPAARIVATQSVLTGRQAPGTETMPTESGRLEAMVTHPVAPGQPTTPNVAAGPARPAADGNAAASTSAKTDVGGPKTGPITKATGVVTTSRPRSASGSAPAASPADAGATAAAATRGSASAAAAGSIRKPEIAAVAMARAAAHPLSRAVARAMANKGGHRGAGSYASSLAGRFPARRDKRSSAAAATLRTIGNPTAIMSRDSELTPASLPQLPTPRGGIVVPPTTDAGTAALAPVQVGSRTAAGIAAAPLQTTGATGGAAVGATLPVAQSDGAGATARTAAGREALAQLSLRPVPHAAPDSAWATPARVLPGPNPALVPTATWRRWAVQVLAGPALTYRLLGTRVALAAMPSSPPIYPSTVTTTSTTTADLARLERPALSGGVQASLQYALTKRWDLRAGLGYSEFATRLALQQVRTGNFSRSVDSTTSIRQRDTYRFLTVPVRLGYGRDLSARWRVSLLGGLDAAFYLGGSTTEGSTCACQARTWERTGSPYRTFSVGASLGGELRYRLNERWALLAQPTGTYLLTPLNKRPTNSYERHLFGATALLGAAWNLP